MIDDDDGDFFLLSGASGWTIVVFLIVASIVYAIASDNASDCLKRSCAVGAPRYVGGECICASEPK